MGVKSTGMNIGLQALAFPECQTVAGISLGIARVAGHMSGHTPGAAGTQTSVSSCETLFWTASSSAVSTPHAERTRPPFEGEIPKSHSKIELLLKSGKIGDGIPEWMPTASGPPARGAALTSIHISIPEGDIHRSRGQGAFKPRSPRFSYNG